MTTLTVGEHDTVVRGGKTGYCDVPTLAGAAFDAVQALVDGVELAPIASPRLHRGQPALKLAQWVGVIRTPDGTVLEILPKTHRHTDDPQESRTLLLKMLAAVDERFKVAPPAELDPARMPLFEVFLRYALEGFRAAIRLGVPHAYVAVQEERSGLRGRLNLTRQLRQLPHRAHKLHVEYDEYLPDRPENRLVRLSVERIARMTKLNASKRLARELLHVLDGVPPSQQVHQDFVAWRLERGHAHFAPLEALCRLVLFELNPLVSGESSRALAVLFDMNRVYEAYVAYLLRQQYPSWRVQTQVGGRALGMVNGQRAFALRPDLLVTLPGGQTIVADTKWKRLRPDEPPTYGVSNADAYQMLAYSEIFQQGEQERQLWLIYPQVDDLPVRLPDIILSGARKLVLVTVDLQVSSGHFPQLQPSDFDHPVLTHHL